LLLGFVSQFSPANSDFAATGLASSAFSYAKENTLHSATYVGWRPQARRLVHQRRMRQQMVVVAIHY
jgi:hypothetical protein